MATFDAALFPLKDGRTLLVRSAEPSDAEACLAYLCQVGGETDFLLVGSEGIDATAEQEAAFLERTKENERGCMLLGFVDDALVSIANAQTPAHPRLCHNAGMGISVLSAYWGVFVGSHMMQCLIDFMRRQGDVRALRLEVYADNARAISLYKRFGFTEIGRRHDYLKVGGEYHDELLMELFL